jgi:hypothetical protein
MTETIVDANQDNGREFRTVTASTKVTDQELIQLESAAAARGERISADQFQAIVRSVRSTKVKAAQEMLARRREPKDV